MPLTAIEPLAGAVLLAGGVALLGTSWRKRRGVKAHLRLGGWVGIVAGFVLFARAWGAEVGVFYGFMAFSLLAYVIVATGIEIREARYRAPREAALEPEERQTSWSRGIAKSLLAIVLAGVASIGIGVAFAVVMPMPVYDRIVIGGILVPLLWGGGMAWTLSDAKLLRATLVLVFVSLASYGIAFLPKVLG